MTDLLAGIASAFHELGESLSGRDAQIAETAARVWGQLNSELVRIAPLIAAARAEIERLDQERGQACYDRDSARSVVKAWEQQAQEAQDERGRLALEVAMLQESIKQLVVERDAKRVEVERLGKAFLSWRHEALNAAEQRDAAGAEVERLTRELEERRETMQTQVDAAQQRTLTLEAENLRLKRLLSPVEEG